MSRHVTSAISQCFGKFASKEFPKWFQKVVNSSYVGLMGLDMREFHAPSTYNSLNALFTRKLREDRKYSLDGTSIFLVENKATQKSRLIVEIRFNAGVYPWRTFK